MSPLFDDDDDFEQAISGGTLSWYCSACGTEFDEDDRGVEWIDINCLRCPKCKKILYR
jgi:NAD-dependent SIR2 family protein deacetylase